MSNCYYCKIKISDIPYRCRFCGMIFCNKHRLPENHECPYDLRKKNRFLNSLDIILYQDALDFMNKDLTVDKIYEYVSTKQMNDYEATDLLTYFIQNSDDIDIRRISIQAFKVLELKNEYVFNTLESCILSDENPIVRKTAKDVIKYIFPKKSQKILKWFLNHDLD